MSNDIQRTNAITIIQRHVEQIVSAKGEYNYLGLQGNASLSLAKYNDARHGDALRAWWDLEHSFGHLRPSTEVTGALDQLAHSDLKLLLEMIDAPKNANVMILLSPSVRHVADLPVGLTWLRSECSPELAALALMRCIKVVSSVARGVTRADGTGAWKDSLRLIGDALASRSDAEEVSLWWQVVANAPRAQGFGGDRMADFCNKLYDEAARRLARHDVHAVLPPPDTLKRYQMWNPCVMAIIPYVASNWPPEQGALAVAAFYRDVERRFWGELHELPRVETVVDMLYLEAAGCAMMLEASWGINLCWRRTILSKIVGRSTCWDRDGSAASAERLAFIIAAACFACLMLKDNAVSREAIVVDVCSVVDEFFSEWMWNLGFPSSIRKCLPRLLAHTYVLFPPEEGARRILAIAEDVRDSSLLDAIRQCGHPVLSSGQDESLAKMIEEVKAYEADLQHVDNQPARRT